MRITYAELGEGGEFREHAAPDVLFPSAGLMYFILQYGEQGLEALPDADEQVQELVEQLIEAGLLERDEGGNLKLTPRMVQGMEHRALLEIFRELRPGVKDAHTSAQPGRAAAGERTDGNRPYEFGDPVSEIDLHATLASALRRGGADAGGRIAIDEGDIHLHNVEAVADCATVVLIDLSGSMARYGRHIAAKKVAMGLRGLIRRRFSLDTVDFVGFASVAEAIPEEQLPLVMPKPITTHEWEVRVRVPLDQAQLTHPHFTNLHHGLQVARGILARRGASNKQIFIITDGQPTAHLSRSREGIGQVLNLIYPPDDASTRATLEEALRCQQLGIRMASFALIEEYHVMEWVGFVEQFTRLTRGTAYYCTAGDLSATLMESYLSGKKQRRALG